MTKTPEKTEPVMTARPIVTSDASGHMTGAGCSVSVGTDRSNVTAGVYRDSQFTTSFFGHANAGVTPSTSLGVGASVNSLGYSQGNVSVNKEVTDSTAVSANAGVDSQGKFQAGVSVSKSF